MSCECFRLTTCPYFRSPAEWVERQPDGPFCSLEVIVFHLWTEGMLSASTQLPNGEEIRTCRKMSLVD